VSNPSSPADQRNLKRWQLIFYLRVFNQEDGTLLGHIVDVHEQGLMLLCDQPLPTGQEFKLWVDVPRDTGPRQRISFSARSLWSRSDINPDFYDTGFQITEITPFALRRLRLLIEEFKFEFKITDE
jgi:hypothetical protein